MKKSTWYPTALFVVMCVGLVVTLHLCLRLDMTPIYAVKPRNTNTKNESRNFDDTKNTGANKTEFPSQSIGELLIREEKDLTSEYTRECNIGSLADLEDSKPRVQLDPERILYPALLWGPNNQLEGFKESILVAIKLNRTLVIPHFFPQHNDRSGPRIHLVSAFNRIDVKKLSEFVSVISMEQMRKHCNSSFDIAFQNRPRWCEAVKEAQIDTGMEILNVTKLNGYNGNFTMTKHGPKCWQPKISALPESVDHHTKHNTNKLKEIFNTTARCAVFLFPFLSLSVTTIGGYRPVEYSEEINIRNITMTESIADASKALLLAAIEHATGRPPYIVKIVERFLREVVNSTFYVAVHWRFDPEMMNSVCKQKSGFCKSEPTPLEVAKCIASVQGQVSESHKQKIPVYIAAPPTIDAFIDKVKFYLENPQELTNTSQSNTTSNATTVKSPDVARVFTARDMRLFLDQRYPPKVCPDIRPTPNELLSLLEMEIGQKSRSFLYSSGSTWSAMILRLRPPKLFPFDRSTMHMIIKQRKKEKR